MVFSLNVVLPTFIMIYMGRLAVQCHIVDRAMMAKIGNITFAYCLSARIFLDVSAADVNQMKDLRMTGYCFAATVLAFILVWLLAFRFLRQKASIGAFVHVCFRSSFTVLGLSMVRNMAGEAGVAKCASLFAMVAIVYNVLAVLCLTKGASVQGEAKNQGFGAMVKDILLKVIKNPLIIAVVLGLPFSIFSFALPGLALKPIQYLGDLAVPLSLLCIGATLDTSKIKEKFNYALLAALTKTLLIALLVVPIAIALGFREIELAIIAILFTTANPSACYIMTVSMQNDGDLAATAIVFSTVLSIFTTTGALYILRSLALI